MARRTSGGGTGSRSVGGSSSSSQATTEAVMAAPTSTTKSLSKWLGSKIYGGLYSSYELPGTKIYRTDEIFHGLALLSDNKGSGYPVRLELTRDLLNIQVPIALAAYTDTPLLNTERCVTVKRHPNGGMGFSVKGGESGSCKVPVIISKVAETETAYTDGPLFVGDVILEVNDVNVEDKTHDEVVQLLKQCDKEVKLKVKFQSGMTHLLHRTTSKKRIEENSEKSTEASESDFPFPPSANSYDRSTLPKGWSPFTSLPLPMAYITRYLWGTDKLRCVSPSLACYNRIQREGYVAKPVPLRRCNNVSAKRNSHVYISSNGFEVRTADGASSGIIYCEDTKIVEHWVHYITAHVMALNAQSIKVSNKLLHPDELIVYLGWVCERLNEEQFDTTDFLKTWEPRFLILKGSSAWFFETPPLNDEDFKNSIMNVKIYETRFRDVKACNRLDKRKHSFIIETVSGEKHYLSVESSEALLQVRRAWNRCTYYAVSKIQKLTFACVKEERPSGLVIDFLQGIGLYDIPSKKYLWWYKFSQIRHSADDGKMRIRLVFENENYGNAGHSVDLDCSELLLIVYALHAFLLARVMSVNPDLLEPHSSAMRAAGDQL